MDRESLAWLRAADRAAAMGGGPVSIEAVCEAGTAAMGADGYGATLIRAPGLRELACASDADGELLEEMQLTSGQGPCTEAYASLTPVLVPDLRAERDRWPLFVPGVAPSAVEAMFTYPLHVAGIRVGAVDFYCRRTGMPSDDQLADAEAFAGVAARVGLREHRSLIAGAEQAMGDPPHGYPAAVHQAAGMLAAQLDVEVGEALVRLRAYAYLNGQPLSELARSVLDRRLTLESDEYPRGN